MREIDFTNYDPRFHSELLHPGRARTIVDPSLSEDYPGRVILIPNHENPETVMSQMNATRAEANTGGPRTSESFLSRVDNLRHGMSVLEDKLNAVHGAIFVPYPRQASPVPDDRPTSLEGHVNEAAEVLQRLHDLADNFLSRLT